MSVIYDNWERVVTATLRREQLREIALRTPSDLSSVSAASPSPSSSFNLNYTLPSSLLVGDSFTYRQLLRATGFFDDSNLIKSGHSGVLYFGVLESRIEVVVKKVDVQSLDKGLCFLSEMETHGKAQHSRLLPLLGYCLDDANEKFLIYKYMPHKDLSRFLNGNSDGGRRSHSLDWTTRLKIATGALEGLLYLHHECSPPLVHGDVQACSILLDDKFEVQLGSLNGVRTEGNDSDKNRNSRFLRLPKGFGQSSLGTSNATRAYDVYCFGKVLLDLITGRLSTSLHEDRLARTLSHIIPDDKKQIVNIVDPSLILDEDLLVEVWTVAFIAKICLSRNPSKRPRVEEILTVLGNLARRHSTQLQSTDHPSLVASTPGIKRIGKMTLAMKPSDISGTTTASCLKFDSMRIRRLFEDNYSVLKMRLQQFSYADIKKITNCFRDKLGVGGSGSVFKGKLSNEVFVAVKLLRNSTRAGEFINEVAMMGIIDHVNVVRLLGFCADERKRALVYEFLPNGSLAKFIFRYGQYHHALGVERLQHIAIRIARGIEYLHQGCEQRILHLDIKPDNILLDNDGNPKISDFGIAKLCGKEISEVSLTEIRGTLGYIAPEVYMRQLGDVSSKSDIYGFGMLLLEMVGRRRIFDPSVQDEREMFFPEWVYTLLTNGEFELRIQVEEDGDDVILKKLAILGLWCIQWKPVDRTPMTSVLQMLQGNGENLSVPPNPFASSQVATGYLSESDYESVGSGYRSESDYEEYYESTGTGYHSESNHLLHSEAEVVQVQLVN